jgi:EmrB/QacA subfamily drug resistance transporter
MGDQNTAGGKTSKTSVLMVATITTFMAPFMISAVNIALPAIQYEFAVDAVLLSWIANAYLLATGVSLVPVGKIADIYGRKKIFVTGIFVFTVFTVGTAFAGSVACIILFRIFQGFGAAMTMTTGIAIIAAVFPLNERGKAIGITVAAVYIGLSVGPFTGGILTTAFGWRSIFLVNAPIGILAFVVSLTKIRDEWADAKGERFDYLGSILYGISLVGVIYGLSILPGSFGIGLLCMGLTGFAVFVWQELRTPAPVFEIRLFSRNRTFSFSSLAALINYAATFAVSFLLSLYLQYIKGMSPEKAGFVLICQPLMQALFSPFAGKLSDRIEPAIIASLGMALTAAGLISLIFLGESTPTAYIVAGLVVLGIGFALFSSPNMNAIMSSVENRYYGVASGTVATMRLIGQMLSMAIATLIFSFMIGKVQISPANYGAFLSSVNLAFTIFSVMCVVGIYFSFTRGSLRKEN